MSDGDKPQPSTRPGVLSLNIKEKTALYAAYMPHVKGGGIFIPTNKPYRLGDDIYMLLSLLDDPTKHPVAGRVVWVTPPGAQGNRAQGIGVKFADDESGNAVRNKIETLLSGMLQSNRPTHTM
ncbi:MAG: PilZ domain-containing protein [Betaproteobacteria bacterium]|nr:PilZ domain-containing protein [Betaproteobacteria bacterium]